MFNNKNFSGYDKNGLPLQPLSPQYGYPVMPPHQQPQHHQQPPQQPPFPYHHHPPHPPVYYQQQQLQQPPRVAPITPASPTPSNPTSLHQQQPQPSTSTPASQAVVVDTKVNDTPPNAKPSREEKLTIKGEKRQAYRQAKVERAIIRQHHKMERIALKNERKQAKVAAKNNKRQDKASAKGYKSLMKRLVKRADNEQDQEKAERLRALASELLIEDVIDDLSSDETTSTSSSDSDDSSSSSDSDLDDRHYYHKRHQRHHPHGGNHGYYFPPYYPSSYDMVQYGYPFHPPMMSSPHHHHRHHHVHPPHRHGHGYYPQQQQQQQGNNTTTFDNAKEVVNHIESLLSSMTNSFNNGINQAVDSINDGTVRENIANGMATARENVIGGVNTAREALPFPTPTPEEVIVQLQALPGQVRGAVNRLDLTEQCQKLIRLLVQHCQSFDTRYIQPFNQQYIQPFNQQHIQPRIENLQRHIAQQQSEVDAILKKIQEAFKEKQTLSTPATVSTGTTTSTTNTTTAPISQQQPQPSTTPEAFQQQAQQQIAHPTHQHQHHRRQQSSFQQPFHQQEVAGAAPLNHPQQIIQQFISTIAPIIADPMKQALFCAAGVARSLTPQNNNTTIPPEEINLTASNGSIITVPTAATTTTATNPSTTATTTTTGSIKKIEFDPLTDDFDFSDFMIQMIEQEMALSQSSSPLQQSDVTTTTSSQSSSSQQTPRTTSTTPYTQHMITTSVGDVVDETPTGIQQDAIKLDESGPIVIDLHQVVQEIEDDKKSQQQHPRQPQQQQQPNVSLDTDPVVTKVYIPNAPTPLPAESGVTSSASPPSQQDELTRSIEQLERAELQSRQSPVEIITSTATQHVPVQVITTQLSTTIDEAHVDATAPTPTQFTQSNAIPTHTTNNTTTFTAVDDNNQDEFEALFAHCDVLYKKRQHILSRAREIESSPSPSEAKLRLLKQHLLKTDEMIAYTQAQIQKLINDDEFDQGLAELGLSMTSSSSRSSK